jgi:hypothetical protein
MTIDKDYDMLPRFRLCQNHEGYFVRDAEAILPRWPRLYSGTTLFLNRVPPTSHYYKTKADALALRAWLTERAAGYPRAKELVLIPSPPKQF